MSQTFTTKIYLPAQAATETEATLLKWHVAEGESFDQGAVLAEAESAKSSFEFEAPCAGTLVRQLCREEETIPIDQPVAEITTDDESMRDAAPADITPEEQTQRMAVPHTASKSEAGPGAISLLGIGGYVPGRVVTNAELLDDFPDMSEEYLFGVTGIRERRWAQPDEKPSDMALNAARACLERSDMTPDQVGAIVLATTTPDVSMPSTACILQDRLGVRGIPAFDLNAACSGWLYGIGMAKGMILSGIADNILVIGVDLQSRLLDKNDKDTYFLFGDGAGATVVSRSRTGHRIAGEVLVADAQGMQMARREFPGHRAPTDVECDPWIRLDGRALFRFATASFSSIIRDVVTKSDWEPEQVRWVVPHQANGRILKAAAAKSGIPFERFYLNIDHFGNTSSASIPLAMIEIERGMQPNDKLVFCSVGSGITAAALSLEW